MAVEIGFDSSISSSLLLNEPSYSTDTGGLLENMTSYCNTSLIYASEEKANFTITSDRSFDLCVSCSPEILPMANGMPHITSQTIGGRTNDHTSPRPTCDTDQSRTGSGSHVPGAPGKGLDTTVTELQCLSSPIESKTPTASFNLPGSGIHQAESSSESAHPDTALASGVVDGQADLGEVLGEFKMGGVVTPIAMKEHKHAKKPAFPRAEGCDTTTRRLSDPTARLRREWVKCSRMNWKLSNSPNISQEEESEEGEASTQGYDSGYHDEMQSKSSKTHDSILGPFSPTVSDSEGPHDSLKKKAKDHVHSSVEEHSHPVPRAISHNKPKRPLLKSHSFSSIGGTSSESVSISSLWGFHTPQSVSDYLSSLGFDDFQSPQLVPDRFIPKNLEHAKPILMKQQSVVGDLPSYPPSSPDYAPVHPETGDLPLGATAKTFFMDVTIPPSPQPLSYDSTSNTPTDAVHPDFASAAAVYTDPSISQINLGRVLLETVPEETASDLSPSPRWLSPRVSVEDVTECKLGANLVVPKKKRLLAQRDSHEQSISSQVESEPENIYFNYDEIAKDRDREETKSCPSLPLPSEDSSQQHRRRKGIYSPPPGLLTWLSTQQTIDEEECPDPEELPWPFSEQARLRKSLTEIQQAQQTSLNDSSCNEEHKPSPVITINDNLLTPVLCKDTLSCSYGDLSRSSCEYWTPPSSPCGPLPSRHLPPDSVGDDKQSNCCSKNYGVSTTQEVLDTS